MQIKEIRRMTAKEMQFEGWEGKEEPCMVIVLEDSRLLYPSRDVEGNGPGVLFGRDGDRQFYV